MSSKKGGFFVGIYQPKGKSEGSKRYYCFRYVDTIRQWLTKWGDWTEQSVLMCYFNSYTEAITAGDESEERRGINSGIKTT